MAPTAKKLQPRGTPRHSMPYAAETLRNSSANTPAKPAPPNMPAPLPAAATSRLISTLASSTSWCTREDRSRVALATSSPRLASVVRLSVTGCSSGQGRRRGPYPSGEDGHHAAVAPGLLRAVEVAVGGLQQTTLLAGRDGGTDADRHAALGGDRGTQPFREDAGGAGVGVRGADEELLT